MKAKAATREKMRVEIEGVRVWIRPDDVKEFTSSMDKIRSNKEWWAQKAWNARVHKELVEKWGGKLQGGRRFKKLQAARRRGKAISMRALRKDNEGERQPVAPALPMRQRPMLMRLRQKCQPPARDQDSEPAEKARWKPLKQKAFVEPQNSNRDNQKLNPIVLKHAADLPAATYMHGDKVACVSQRPTINGFDHIPFAPQPVADWLYEVSAHVLISFQKLLGEGGFDAGGNFLKCGTEGPASGGQISAFWGTELGSRRDQAMIAWDYDVDLVVFLTPDFDFANLWELAQQDLEPLGLRFIEHNRGFKYRIAPESPLALSQWKELVHELKLLNPGVSRSLLCRKAAAAKKEGQLLQIPTGATASTSRCIPCTLAGKYRSAAPSFSWRPQMTYSQSSKAYLVRCVCHCREAPQC